MEGEGLGDRGGRSGAEVDVGLGVPAGLPADRMAVRRGVEAVVAVELELLGGRQVLAHAEVRRVLDQRLVVRDPEFLAGELARGERDEGVPAEDAGADGRPLRLSGGVVQVDLVDRADLVSVAVDSLVADEVTGIDVGLHAFLQCAAPAEVPQIGDRTTRPVRHFTPKAMKRTRATGVRPDGSALGRTGDARRPGVTRSTRDRKASRWYPGRRPPSPLGRVPDGENHWSGRRRSNSSPESLRHPYRAG